jgi:hypothetical protein
MKKLFKLAFKFEDSALLASLERDSLNNPNLDLTKLFQKKENGVMKLSKKKNEKSEFSEIYENKRGDALNLMDDDKKLVRLQILPKNIASKLLNLQKKGKLKNLAVHIARSSREGKF